MHKRFLRWVNVLLQNFLFLKRDHYLLEARQVLGTLRLVVGPRICAVAGSIDRHSALGAAAGKKISNGGEKHDVDEHVRTKRCVTNALCYTTLCADMLRDERRISEKSRMGLQPAAGQTGQRFSSIALTETLVMIPLVSLVLLRHRT